MPQSDRLKEAKRREAELLSLRGELARQVQMLDIALAINRELVEALGGVIGRADSNKE